MTSQKWAEFRFSVVGSLLASPPHRGELRQRLHELSQKDWKHPMTGKSYQICYKTIEEWYYQARKGINPVDALASKQRSDSNLSRAIDSWMKEQLQIEINNHPGWSKKLHSDNLAVLIKNNNGSKIPSYASVNRYLNSIGYHKKSSKSIRRKGYQKSLMKKRHFEQRSYEHPYVGSLYHLDFHHCSREIITSSGEIIYPVLLCILDDRSRLICHCQWYLSESAENLVHGFIQALQKRGLPRALMSDNGKAMLSSEFTSGLKKLSIIHETTLPYSPEQNGKQEVLWSQVEGRLMSMIENKNVITLKELNIMTQAWAEMEYNRKIHSEIENTPLNIFLSSTSVTRNCPDTDKLRKVFRRTENRIIRRTDGTISVEGVRFEIPQRYRHLKSISIQYCLWDLSNVDISCPNTGRPLVAIRPINKQKNSDGKRRSIINDDSDQSIKIADEIAPIMVDLLAQYSSTGLPAAYQPKDE